MGYSSCTMQMFCGLPFSSFVNGIYIFCCTVVPKSHFYKMKADEEQIVSFMLKNYFLHHPIELESQAAQVLPRLTPSPLKKCILGTIKSSHAI